MTANIAKNASKRYFHKTRQNFTEGTLGGLIQLLDFEIVATHLGPRPQKITLLVKDFQGLGSNGMGEVGMAPQAIESREETKALLEMLKEFRDLEKSANHQTRSSQERSISESLLVSQVGSNPPSEDNYMNSQAEFATQAPRRATVPLGSKANPIEANINTDVSSHAIVNDSRTSTTSFEPAASEFDVKKLGKTIFTDQRPTLTQHSLQRQNVNRSKGPVNSASDLLGLIQNVNRVPISTVSTRGGNTEVEGRRHRKTPIIDSAQGVESTGDVTMPTGYINELVSRENLSPAVGADAIKISTMSKKRKRLIQENEKRKVEDDAMFSLVEHNMNLTAGEGAKPELAQQYEWMSKTSPVSAGSQFIDHPLNSTTPTSAAPPLWAPAEPFVLRHVAPAANRISDAEVKISKDQEALLNSPNCRSFLRICPSWCIRYLICS